MPREKVLRFQPRGTEKVAQDQFISAVQSLTVRFVDSINVTLCVSKILKAGKSSSHMPQANDNGNVDNHVYC